MSSPPSPPGWGTPPGATPPGPPFYGAPPPSQPPYQGPPYQGSPQGPRPPQGRGDDNRSIMILVLAVSSFFALLVGCTACGPLALASLGFSIPALVMSRRDLRAMDAGTMSPQGRDVTHVSMILSIVSTVLGVLVGLLMIVLVILYGGLIGFAILAQPR